MEARTMRLLLYLADRAGEVVSIDELLKEVWSGVIVTSDSVYQAVASLRRVLGDEPRQPTYIITVPRRGYRMIASVSPAAPPPPRPRRRAPIFLAAGLVLALAIIAGLVFRLHPPERSIVVMPFVDLTEDMSHEYWADGVTEEVIDKLSKTPGLHVYLKQKPIARAAYELDGSVRKSGSMLRVAARLSRRDTGYVVWSETYDRPLGDIIMLEDDIASAVAKALAQTA